MKSLSRAIGLALVLVGTAAGCGVVAAYGKCGLGGCPGDAAITAEVERSLAQHPALQAPNLISVQTVDRVVYLSGLVDTDFERQLAEGVAARTTGVGRVVDSIGLAGNR